MWLCLGDGGGWNDGWGGIGGGGGSYVKSTSGIGSNGVGAKSDTGGDRGRVGVAASRSGGCSNAACASRDFGFGFDFGLDCG